MNIGLYLHIPFCKSKCLYCDFPSYSNLTFLYEEYVAALCREIHGWGGVLSDTIIDTIYIGGGTPTILPTKYLVNILESIYTNFKVDKLAEVSIEANPGTVDIDKLRALRANGINRISLGVQSFANDILCKIGRIHTAEDATMAVYEAQNQGINNINIDLMYGLPHQSLNSFQESLAAAVALNITHISVYGLKVEEDTPFYQMQLAGDLALPDEAVDEAMYEYVTDFLPKHRFERYEISNYATAGNACRHNLKYWQYKQYLGLGAAAHSFLKDKRLANTTDVKEYITAIEKGKSPIVNRESNSKDIAMAEYAFLALRTSSGINLQEFNNYFKADFFSLYGTKLNKLVEQKLLEVDVEKVYLTKQGMKYGNVVFEQFLPD